MKSVSTIWVIEWRPIIGRFVLVALATPAYFAPVAQNALPKQATGGLDNDTAFDIVPAFDESDYGTSRISRRPGGVIVYSGMRTSGELQ